MLTIPSLLSRADGFCTLDVFQPSQPNIECLIEDLDCLDEKLQAWWLNYQKRIIGNDGQGRIFDEIANDSADFAKFSPTERPFRDEETAECLIYCELSRFLVTLVRALFCDTVMLHFHRNRAIALSASILCAAGCTGSQIAPEYPNQCFGFISLLQIVALGSPDPKHRFYAANACKVSSKRKEQPIFRSIQVLPFWRTLRDVWDRPVAMIP